MINNQQISILRPDQRSICDLSQRRMYDNLIFQLSTKEPLILCESVSTLSFMYKSFWIYWVSFIRLFVVFLQIHRTWEMKYVICHAEDK